MPSVDGDDCTCSFNGVHVVWIVALILAVIGGAAGGYFYYKKKQNTSDLYSQMPSGTKHEGFLNDDSDRESGRQSSPSGTTFM